MTYRELVEEYYYSFDYWNSIEEFAKEYKINNLKYFKGLVSEVGNSRTVLSCYAQSGISEITRAVE